MDENKVIVYGQPFGKQRPRVTQFGGFAHAYTPKETVNYETLVKQEYIHANGKYFADLPLSITIKAYFEIPKSFSKLKAQKALSGELRPMTKPDYDNIAKIVTDALNTVAYADDKQIVKADISKYYSDRPRVEIEIDEIKF